MCGSCSLALSGTSATAPFGCGLLHRYLCTELVEEGVDLCQPLPDEPTVGLHLGLIPDGIQDGLLLRHLLGLGEGELRLQLRHVQSRSKMVCLFLPPLVLLHRL
ncbi:Cytochrome P450 87A3 [Hordeum vulgare]|nr:Cytochrome P450 87A3 [Hordeum vulgare]